MGLHKNIKLAVFLAVLGGCSRMLTPEVHDPELNTTRDSYKALTPSTIIPPHVSKKKAKPIVSEPALPGHFHTLVSVDVGESIPIKDVFMEVARQAKANVSLDPRVQGSTVLYAQKKPFIEIVKHLCNSQSLRYSIEGDMVVVEPDDPYLKNYDIQFLNVSRKRQNKTSVSTDIFSDTQGAKIQIDNGSNTLLTDGNTTDFWAELEVNIKSLLKNSNPYTKESNAPVDFSIHKQGGIVSVFGTSKQQHMIQDFIDKLKKAVSSQVLIEAKIMEVNLNQSHKTGINWDQLRGSVNVVAPLENFGKDDTQAVALKVKGDDFSVIAKFMEQFGTSRILSNPRLTVMNNQSAVLKVATNQVFFKIQYDREVGVNNKPDVERTSSQVQTIPVGIVMIVHPSIDTDTGEITMTIRPTISRVKKVVQDPASAALPNSPKNEVPEVEVREMDSVLKMTSGDTIIMGGLMQDESQNASAGLPDVQEVPLLSWLAGSKQDAHTVNELVIFLKASILERDAGESISNADKDLYSTFTKDPRPLDLPPKTEAASL